MKFLFASFLLFLAAVNVLACSCANSNSRETPSDRLKYFETIFQGKLISRGQIVEHKTKNSKGKMYISSLTYELEFEVQNAWKGVETEKVKIETEPTTCHGEYSIGKSYLMLAYRLSNKANLIDANYCARQRVSLEDIKKEFGEGRSFEPAKPQSENQGNFWLNLWNSFISIFA